MGQRHKGLQRGGRLLVAVNHQIALAQHARQRGVDLAEPAAGQQVGHHPPRQAGRAQAFSGGMLDGFRAAQLDAAPVSVQVRQQQLVSDFARA